MTVKLLPCPFCGGTAKLWTLNRTAYRHVVQCTRCEAVAGGTTFQNDEWNAEQWNARDLGTMKRHPLYIEVCNEVRDLQMENYELRSKRFVTFAEDECWIYDEHEDNHLESLVCPVVIDPKVLIKLIGQANEK